MAMMAILSLLFFLPAIVLIFIPNNIYLFFAAVFLICIPYMPVLENIHELGVLVVVAINSFPALFFKLIAIEINKKGNKLASYLLPILGLAGPAFYLIYATPISNLTREHPPSNTCMAANFKLKIAEHVFYISPINFFKIDQKDSTPNTIKKLCENTDNGKIIFKAKTIEFVPGRRGEDKICDPKDKPQRAFKSFCDLERYLNERDPHELGGRNVGLYSISIFEKNANYNEDLYIDAERDKDCNPLCERSYLFQNNIVVIYKFNLPIEKKEEAGLVVDQHVKNIVSEWAVEGRE